ncbi:hypothetical protein MSAN_00104100 [Mycena sanguinolenta]|uniref:Uncharacterized protein n=1 Tax=Mycena sanguinolenta TaxID=230812 RepID=A0A8H6ZIF1_9AGAR|nr:hypothetical protein MSAN_00104100 [Mycena sanguinolenta]
MGLRGLVSCRVDASFTHEACFPVDAFCLPIARSLDPIATALDQGAARARLRRSAAFLARRFTLATSTTACYSPSHHDIRHACTPGFARSRRNSHRICIYSTPRLCESASECATNCPGPDCHGAHVGAGRSSPSSRPQIKSAALTTPDALSLPPSALAQQLVLRRARHRAPRRSFRMNIPVPNSTRASFAQLRLGAWRTLVRWNDISAVSNERRAVIY